LQKWKGYVLPLAGVSELTVSPPGPKPRQSAAHVAQAMEIYVPLAGVIDLDAERARVLKEIAKADADLTAVQRKLGNPSFVERAPAEVVQKDRERVEELKARKAKLHDHLQRIAPEDAVPDPTNPQTAPPPVSSIVTNPETAKVKIGEAAAGKVGAASGDTVDLAQELAGDLAGVKVPDQVDPTVKEALDKLRKGTAQGLSATDHYDLGVAYMGMGLVDDAVREFNVAKDGKAKGAGKALAEAKAKVGGGKAPAGKAKVKAKASKAGAAVKAAAKKVAGKAKAVKAKVKARAKAAAKKPARKK
jgi:valyl-tRNA synthetase